MVTSPTAYRIALAALALVAGAAIHAQPIRPLPASRVQGALEQLRSLTSVLYVAAHPDDENTRLLAWLSHGRNIRTAYLSITRGDGGQNILGKEQGPALGLIRTHELLAARRLDGASQMFGRAVDFGFSKSSDEAFKHWNARQLVADVVWAYRRFRPDVVICRFPKDSMAGHGQHAVSAIVAEKAFELASNPASFPEHMALGAQPWKPTRLLFNSFRFGTRSTVQADHFRLDVGHYDPSMGLGYGELAGISRSIHRSQGAGTPSTPGVQPEYFQTIVGSKPTRSLFDDIDTTWTRIGRADIGRAVDSLVRAFDVRQPQRLLPALLRVRTMIAGVRDIHWRNVKLEEINAIILSCMGLAADVTVPRVLAVAGDSVTATVRLVARAGTTVIANRITFPDGTALGPLRLDHDSLRTATTTIRIPAATPPTQPYWLAADPANDMFVLPHDSLLGSSVSPMALPVTLALTVMGETVDVEVPLSSKRLDPLRGDVIEALRIVPEVSVEPVEPVTVAAADANVGVRLRVRSYRRIRDAVVELYDGKTVVASAAGVSLDADRDTIVSVVVPKLMQTTSLTLQAVVRHAGTQYEHAVRTIAYDHLPTLQYLEPCRPRIVPAAWTCTAKRIGFVEGAGDGVVDFLRSAGLVVDVLSDAELLRADELMRYDAIVTGVRVVNTRPSMKFILPALHQYVARGGTLVMQYNTTQDMATKDLGPFPFVLGRERVTEEDAAVEVADSLHVLLTTPNRITAGDFDGWVQERGLYFPSSWDARYSAPLRTHDANEAPLQGSVLYAQHGKGHYWYCSLAMFRQLPAGVQGAAKLMMNMLSVGR